jgi:hypothetical protein
MLRIGAARLFEPDDCLVGARLQQMHNPDLEIPIADVGITGTEPDGLPHERNRLLYRPDVELALAKSG